MKDNVRKELKELCYFIIENNNALSRPEQLTRVQMLYERLLVLNYLEEIEEEKKKQAGPKPVTTATPTAQPKATEPSPVEEKKAPISEAPQNSPEATNVAPKRPVSAPATNQTAPEKPNVEEPSAPSASPSMPSPENRDVNDGHQAPKSINDQLAKGPIQVGLNDRIAFVKHLFNDSQADFNRVLSQLNTLDTYLESMYFIENLVKPDYDWEDKKPYEDRLINLVKKRFGEDW